MSKDKISVTDDELEEALRQKLRQTPLAEVGLEQCELDLLEAAGFQTPADLIAFCNVEETWKISQIGEKRKEIIRSTFALFLSATRADIRIALEEGGSSLQSKDVRTKEFGDLVLPDEDAKIEIRRIRDSWSPRMRVERGKGKIGDRVTTVPYTIQEVSMRVFLTEASDRND